MSQANVLFDTPGPTTRARHRMYTVIASTVLAGLLGYAIVKLWQADQFDSRYWEPLVTSRIVGALLEGLLATLSMAVAAVVGAVLIGALLGVAKLSDHRLMRWPAWLWVEFFRAVPLLMLMVALWYFIGPQAGSHSYWAVVLGLWLYNGSVLAEIFRAGVNAVPTGQSEAAYSLGLRKSAVMGVILLPQAVKIMIPAIISQSVVALKDTTLGYAVLAPGLVYVGGQVSDEFRSTIPTMATIGAIFIALNLMLSWLANWAQRRYAGEKKIDVVAVAATGKDLPTP